MRQNKLHGVADCILDLQTMRCTLFASCVLKVLRNGSGTLHWRDGPQLNNLVSNGPYLDSMFDLVGIFILRVTIAGSSPGNLQGESGTSAQIPKNLRAPPGTSGHLKATAGGPLGNHQIISSQ